MSSAGWHRVMFKDALSHAVPGFLLEPLCMDLLERGHPIEDLEKRFGKDHAASLGGNPKAITEWGFDVGGMYFTGMPTETISVDGLTIRVACDAFDVVGETIAKVAAEQPRRFANKALYYKLRFWHHATVLSPTQFAIVKGEVERLEKSALAKAKAYFEEHPILGKKTQEWS